MKEIIFNRKDYKSYQDFYADVYEKLDGKENWDFDYCTVPLGYSPDTLNEFLWYYHNDGIKYIFLNFNKERIKLQKNYDDYEYNLVIEVFEEFVEQYPNNAVEFSMEEK